MPDSLAADASRPRVLLDASAIVGAGYGRSSGFRRLLREAADGRIELFVPELAIVETTAVLKRKLKNMKMASKEATRLLAAGGIQVPSLDDVVAECENHIRQSLTEAHVSSVPSAADHDALVRRILDRRKPTKPANQDAQGRELDDQHEDYRDQLLWAMTRGHAKPAPLILISANTADFADPEKIDTPRGRAQLHADLLEDLAADEAAGGSGKVDLYLTIRRVVDEILPRPEDEDDRLEVQGHLARGASASLGLALRDYVHSSSPDVMGYRPSIPITSSLEEAVLVDIDPDVDAVVVDAYQASAPLEPRRYEVSLEVQASGHVAWLITAVSTYDMDALSGLVQDPDGGGIVQEDDYEETLHLRAAGAYLPSTGEWLEVEVEEAEQPEHEVKERDAQVPDPYVDAMVEEMERRGTT